MRRKQQAGGVRGRRNRPSRRHNALTFEQLEARLVRAVVISEFLADNASGIVDFADERQDWIELSNTGPTAVDLTGWHLTDDASNLTRWQFPATTIGAGEYLSVFASGKDGQFSGELHTNFSLSKNGEDLALVTPDGSTIADSYLAYPEQFADVSYGLGVTTDSTTNDTLVGGSSTVRVMSPTGENAAVDDYWHDVDFDDSGWLSGTGGVGFDHNSDGIDLSPYIGRTLTVGEMNSADATPQYSAYVRYDFDVADKDQLTTLQLDLRFDDGFIAYLNGKEVRRVNFAEDFVYTQPQWNSYAGNQLTSSTSGAANRIAESTGVVTFDLTPYLPLIQNGQNVLAFHGVNSKSSSSGNTNKLDFLIQPVLTSQRATGSAQVGYMVGATPGGDNGLSTLGFVADTSFSIDRGFYDAPQAVEITTTTPDATIRYTTDGSAPTLTNGTTYIDAIDISTTTTLRAAAFKDGYTPTNVDTQTYIFLDDVLQQDDSYAPPSATWGHDKEDEDSTSGYNLDEDDRDWEMDPDVVDGNEAAVKEALTSIPTMSIVMNWDDLFGGDPLPGTFPGTSTVAPNPQGLYIMGRSDERYTSLEYIDPSLATDPFQVDAAIEIQGHSSPTRWNSDKLSLQVKFKFPYGDTTLNSPLFADSPDGASATTQFDTLILDAMYNYSWIHANPVQRDYARFVTDQVTSDLQNLASGGGQAPHGEYVHLYLNGLYWGLYNVHERPDDSFAAEYYGGDKDDYYAVKHANQDIDHEYTWVEGGVSAEESYNNLLTATRLVGADPSNAANYQAVEDLLDIDQFIDYMLVHYYVGDKADWAHNNWYATFNYVDPGGKWRFHAWDQEHAFPTTDNGDSYDEETDVTQKNDFEAPTEIHQNLIGNEEYRLRFSDRVQALMFNGGPLTDAVAQAVYQARVDEITTAIIGESARWGDNRNFDDPYTQADFLNTTSNLLAAFFAAHGSFPGRNAEVLGQFEGVSHDEPGNNNNWLVSLAAPQFSQYGGEISAGFMLSLSKPAGSPGGATIYYTLDGSDPRLAGGGLSPTAFAYSEPLTLNDSTRVKARIFSDSLGTANDWSAVVDATFKLDEPFPVRIVELNYHPASYPGVADEEDIEFIELLNIGDQPVNLADVQITGAIDTYTFDDTVNLAAGERIVVARNRTAFEQVYGTEINLAPGDYDGKLDNAGESVILLGPFGETLQNFFYDDHAPWPEPADGDGYSLEYVGPLDGQEDPLGAGDPFDDAANWRASLQMLGSPGTDGEVALLAGDYDRSGTVDPLDYTKWKTDFGTTVAAPGDGADGNLNGRVDAADYTVWRNNLGATNVGAGGGAMAAVAPAVVDGAETADDSDAADPIGFVFDLTSSIEHDGGALATTAGDADPVADAIDRNLVLWQLLGQTSERAIDDADAGELASSQEAADELDLSALWEDDAWLGSLGTVF